MANEKLILEINEGCPRGFNFTIKQRVCNTETNEYDIVPLPLNGLTVRVEIKKAPYFRLPPLIRKDITEVENPDVGVITDPTNGKFTLQINQDDSTMLPHGEYSLMICLVDKDTYTHISGDGDSYAIYRVCYQ